MLAKQAVCSRVQSAPAPQQQDAAQTRIVPEITSIPRSQSQSVALEKVYQWMILIVLVLITLVIEILLVNFSMHECVLEIRL